MSDMNTYIKIKVFRTNYLAYQSGIRINTFLYIVIELLEIKIFNYN